jgi:hypothetical protein
MAAKRKQRLSKQEFLSEHPQCCYCNGLRRSEERDHAPARIIFRGRNAPEEFEFPACGECNRAAALSEQVTAFYIRSIDADSVPLDAAEFDKLIQGIVNNAPDALPYKDASSAPLTSSALDADVAVRTVSIPKAAKRHISLFGSKMLYAMHYRVAGKPANSSQRSLVMWAQAGSEAADIVRERANLWFDDLKVGQRGNVDLGNQFRYQTGHNPAHGYLGLHMSFGEALVYFCVLGPAKEMARLTPKPELYRTIRALGREIKPRRA